MPKIILFIGLLLFSYLEANQHALLEWVVIILFYLLGIMVLRNSA